MKRSEFLMRNRTGQLWSILSGVDENKKMLLDLLSKVGGLMLSLDELKAEMDELQVIAAATNNQMTAAIDLLTSIGQRLIDEASVATDLNTLRERVDTIGTELQGRATQLGEAIMAVPPPAPAPQP